MSSYELYHHGVKGQKWGVRKHKLDENFTMKTKSIKIGKTPATSYKWFDSNQKPVARFNTFDWWDGKNIEDLFIYDEYKGRRYSYQLLDYATKKLGVKNLSVEKSNTLAKHVYDKYGFKTTYEDDKYYYMSIKGEKNK